MCGGAAQDLLWCSGSSSKFFPTPGVSSFCFTVTVLLCLHLFGSVCPASWVVKVNKAPTHCSSLSSLSQLCCSWLCVDKSGACLFSGLQSSQTGGEIWICMGVSDPRPFLRNIPCLCDKAVETEHLVSKAQICCSLAAYILNGVAHLSGLSMQ